MHTLTHTHTKEGKCIFFDDSFEHEVMHTPAPGDGAASKGTRIVLLIRFWHPDINSSKWAVANKMAEDAFRSHMVASTTPPL